MIAKRKNVRQVRRAARKLAGNPVLQAAERLGYVVRGVLYGGMGLLALAAALGLGGMYTDQRGAIGLIGGGIIGRVVLIAFAVGIGAYCLWGFVRAIIDPFRRGDDPVGLAARAGFLWSGLVYGSLVLFAIERLAALPTSNDDSVHHAVVQLLQAPAGRWITIGVGVVGLAGGLAQFSDAYLATFRDYLKRGMNRAERVTVEWLGRAGMISRGVVFSLVGWFVLAAGISGNSQQAGGYGAAFATIAAAPFGRLLLALVALGFVALGLHSLASARWTRLRSSGG